MISFDPLWETMDKKGVTKYRLHRHHNISKSQLHRLAHNESVSTNTLDRLCNILRCKIEDICIQIQDDNVF